MNPIILAYNGSHFESLDTISEEDDTKAIDLVESVKLGEYTLAKKDIQNIMRITKTKQKENRITIEPTRKAKVNKWDYSNTYQHTCKGCGNNFKIKNDLVQHVRQTNKHNTCLTCNEVLWGDRAQK